MMVQLPEIGSCGASELWQLSESAPVNILGKLETILHHIVDQDRLEVHVKNTCDVSSEDRLNNIDPVMVNPLWFSVQLGSNIIPECPVNILLLLPLYDIWMMTQDVLQDFSVFLNRELATLSLVLVLEN